MSHLCPFLKDWLQLHHLCSNHQNCFTTVSSSSNWPVGVISFKIVSIRERAHHLERNLYRPVPLDRVPHIGCFLGVYLKHTCHWLLLLSIAHLPVLATSRALFSCALTYCCLLNHCLTKLQVLIWATVVFFCLFLAFVGSGLVWSHHSRYNMHITCNCESICPKDINDISLGDIHYVYI